GVVVGVAVGPQHQLAVGVEVDGRGDLLLAVDHPAADEVGDLLHLGGGLGGRAAVGDVGGVAGVAAAAAPLVGPVPVQVGADGAGALVGLGVLPPRLVGAVGDVVLAAVRVDVGQDPDLPGIDQLGHLGVAAVVLGEGAQQVDSHLHGQVLAGVLGVGEQHLGAVVVGADVGGDLHRDQLAALVRGADDLLGRQVRVVRDGRVDHLVEFGEGVVVGVLRREVADPGAAAVLGAG